MNKELASKLYDEILQAENGYEKFEEILNRIEKSLKNKIIKNIEYVEYINPDNYKDPEERIKVFLKNSMRSVVNTIKIKNVELFKEDITD